MNGASEDKESASFQTIKEGLFVEVYEAEASAENYTHENELYQKYILEETMGGVSQADQSNTSSSSDGMETDDGKYPHLQIFLYNIFYVDTHLNFVFF